MVETQIVAQLVRQRDDDIDRRDKTGLVIGGHVAVGLVVTAPGSLCGIAAVDGRTERIAQPRLGVIGLGGGLQTGKGMVALDGIGHVRQAQHRAAILFLEGVQHDIDVLIRVPDVPGIGLCGHESRLVDGVFARVANVFHAGRGERLAALVLLGQYEAEAHIGAFAVDAALIDLVDILQQVLETACRDILGGVVGILIKHVEDDGQLVHVVAVHGGRGAIFVLVGPAVADRQAVVAPARGHQQHCRQQQ